MDNPRKEAKKAATGASVPGEGWTDDTLVCFGPTEDEDLPLHQCQHPVPIPSCRASVMGHPKPHGLPGTQMPWETPLNGFGYTEKRCFKTNKQKSNNNKTPKQNMNYNINMQNGKAIKKKKNPSFLVSFTIRFVELGNRDVAAVLLA